MDNPHVVARALGAAVPLGAVAFVVTRKLCGPSGSADLERLKRIAGMAEGESRAKLMLRDWLPWGAAGLAAVLVFGFFFLVGGGFGRSFTTADLPKLRAGFVDGCVRECGSKLNPSWCSELCDCSFGELRARHPSDDELLRWFGSALKDRERTQRDFVAAQAVCVRRMPPPP